GPSDVRRRCGLFLLGGMDVLEQGQKELYQDVMEENYGLLTSLGYAGTKLNLLSQMEQAGAPRAKDQQDSLEGESSEIPSF
ncbi:unnamed protein product, partial [Natator depressus]